MMISLAVATASLLPSTQPLGLSATSRAPAPRMGLGEFIGRFRDKKPVEAAPQIEIGAKLPEVDIEVLPTLTPEQSAAYASEGSLPDTKVCTIAEALGEGKSLLVGMPGAFTPTCTDLHLPGYMRNEEKLSSYGVNKIAIVTTNDRHVNEAWRKSLVDCEGVWGASMEMLSDGDADLVKALGLCDDMGFGYGTDRAKRFTLIVDDGVVSHVAVDEGMVQLEDTKAEKIVAKLRTESGGFGGGGGEMDEDRRNAAGAIFLAIAGAGAYAFNVKSGGQLPAKKAPPPAPPPPPPKAEKAPPSKRLGRKKKTEK